MTNIARVATHGQNRARGLYDEQHQRLQQEKILLRARASRPVFFADKANVSEG